MAEKDKARYDLEMQNYVPPKGVVIGRGKKRKQIKDPNAPKRSLYVIIRIVRNFNFNNFWIFLLSSAFFWFCNDERTKVKALNPEYGVGDIAKELGKKWSDVEPSTKSKYEAMAEKDKKRYEVVSILFLALYLLRTNFSKKKEDEKEGVVSRMIDLHRVRRKMFDNFWEKLLHLLK